MADCWLLHLDPVAWRKVRGERPAIDRLRDPFPSLRCTSLPWFHTNQGCGMWWGRGTQPQHRHSCWCSEAAHTTCSESLSPAHFVWTALLCWSSVSKPLLPLASLSFINALLLQVSPPSTSCVCSTWPPCTPCSLPSSLSASPSTQSGTSNCKCQLSRTIVIFVSPAHDPQTLTVTE